MGSRSLFDGALWNNLDAFDPLPLDGLAAIDRRLADLLQHVLALDEMTKGGVVAVEVLRGIQANEELAARRIRVLGAGHGNDSGHMMALIEFCFHIMVGAAASPHRFLAGVLAERIAALNHETLDDAMKSGAIVETIFRQLDEVGDRVRRDVGPEFDHHLAGGRFNDGDLFLIGRAQGRGSENGGEKDGGKGNKEGLHEATIATHPRKCHAEIRREIQWTKDWLETRAEMPCAPTHLIRANPSKQAREDDVALVT